MSGKPAELVKARLSQSFRPPTLIVADNSPAVPHGAEDWPRTTRENAVLHRSVMKGLGKLISRVQERAGGRRGRDWDDGRDRATRLTGSRPC